MPATALLASSNQAIRLVDLPASRNTIVVYYSTHCSICRELVASIDKNANRFNNVNMVLMASASLEEVDQFAKRINYKGAFNMFNGIDSGQAFLGYYKISQVPEVYIYDGQKKLIASYAGNTGVQELLKYN